MMLTPDQQIVFEAIIGFAKRPSKSHITVGGYAGTGKTTVTAHSVLTLRSLGFNNIGFCCYTGKAASVLRGKLTMAGVLVGNAYCGTIHSLIYDVRVDSRGRIVGFDRKPQIDEKLLIVDEASMVNEDIWNDLLSYHVPIIAVGDHGQLPPIDGAFNLMETPMFKLEKIHRQAEDNPIIKLATMARESGEIPFGPHGVGVFRGAMKDDKIIGDGLKWNRLRTTLYLAGFNKTRNRINARVREALGYKGDPQPGEKVICLKNNRELGIFNGLTGTLVKIHERTARDYKVTIRMDNGGDFNGQILIDQFGAEKTLLEHPEVRPHERKDVNLFDFGYCLTVHKAQGSEADSVLLLEERSQHMDDEQWRRWLYTGVTRAKKYLTIVNRRYPRPVVAATR